MLRALACGVVSSAGRQAAGPKYHHKEKTHEPYRQVATQAALARRAHGGPVHFGGRARVGRPDLILRHTATGAAACWYVQGANVVGSPSLAPTPGADWRIVGP
jgi:hypothetical protein